MRKLSSKDLQELVKNRPIYLIVGVILVWGIVPWLYVAPPEFLWGKPISLYAAFSLVAGLALLCALVLHILRSLAGRHAWAGTLSSPGGRLLLITVLTGIVAVPYFLSPLAPSQCAYNSVIVASADAQGQNCTRTCTNWEAADCGGWSACFNKNISCVDGIDQNGRNCQGCCFDCQVVCENADKPPSINGTVACDGWGNSGWCRSNAKLSLTTSDPQGYATSISGSLNGTPFTCGSACVLDLSNGTGSASFQVTAAISGMTDNGSATWTYDPEVPSVGLDASGAGGDNGWYVSNVEVMATGADTISGLADVLLSVDGGPWQAMAVLSDGVHTVDVSGQDQAGNVASVTALVSVDTITPSLNLSLSGTLATGGWYTTPVQLAASAVDSGSGLAVLEVSIDGGGYNGYTDPVSLSGGRHSYQFRASDNAGNVTETPVQYLNVDAAGPAISLPATWDLGRTVTYNVQDDMSGLAFVRVVIEDDDERWPKVAWNEDISGNTLNGEIDWNGRFKDGTIAPPGQYLATVKASDNAGNEAWKTGVIIVEGNSLMQLFALPASAPTAAPPEPAPNLPVPSPAPQKFGGAANSPQSGGGIHSLSISSSAGGAQIPLPWAPIAAAATLGVSAAYVSGQRKVAPHAKGYRQIARLYQQAMTEKEEREKEAAEQAEALAAQKEEDRARTALGYAMLRQQAVQKEILSHGVGNKVLPAPAQIQGDPPPPPSIWDKIKGVASRTVAKVVDTVVHTAQAVVKDIVQVVTTVKNTIVKAIHTLSQPPKSHHGQPTPDVRALYTQAAQTLIPQFTQTMQARSTPAATATSTPFLISTPARAPMVVLADGLKLRLQPAILSAEQVIIPKGGIVYVESNSMLEVRDGYCWIPITYINPAINAKAIGASPQFLDPLSNFYRLTAQGDPISYSNAVSGWNGKHIGEDYAPLAGGDPNPVIQASASGIVTNAGVQAVNGETRGYGNYVIIEYPASSLSESIHNLPAYSEGKSLYAIYAHLLDNVDGTLPKNAPVQAGTPIGQMGASGNTGGFIHLHFELRMGDPNQKLNASYGDWYDPRKVAPIDPALIITPNDTWAGWAAQSQWSAQAQCAAGEPYLGIP